MSLDLVFYDGLSKEEILIVSFGSDGFAELIELGLGKVPQCTAPDGTRAVDLKIFQVKVGNIMDGRKIPHQRTREIMRALIQYRYMAINP
jgi:hypothetical protein